jgi:hypothetical protein
MPLALTNALWEVAYAYHAEAEEDLTDSGRVVSKPEVIQMAPRGSVTISRLADSDVVPWPWILERITSTWEVIPR